MSRYSKTDYEWYKARHICVACRSKPAFGKMVKCPECLEKGSQYTADWQARYPGRHEACSKRWYDRMKTEGRCTKCGKPNPNAGQATCCPACARKNALLQKAHRVRKVKPDGICKWCDKPVYEGKKLCYEHYLQAAERMRRVRPGTANHPWRRNKKARIMEIKEKWHGRQD